MGEDARNSIYLWAGSIAVFAFLWATLAFDLMPTIPDNWFVLVMGIFLLMNLVEIARLLWKRRALSEQNFDNE